MYELKLTDIGEGLHEAEILKWFVEVGESVKNDDPIVEVQTDKAAVEITSPKSGEIKLKNGEEGDTIIVGDTIVEIELDYANFDQKTKEAKEKSEEKAAEQFTEQQKYPHLKKSPDDKRILAAPSVRKFARNKEINLAFVQGSEKSGRITKQDVLNYIDDEDKQSEPVSVPQKTEVTKYVQQEEDEVIKIKGLRKKIYKNMEKSAFTIPRVTGMEEVNADQLIELRSNINKTSEHKITYLPIIIKMVVEVLKKNPIFNASINEESLEIVMRRKYNIGIATATSQGLIVPVIHDADKKSVEEIATEIQELSQKAEQGKLGLKNLQGSTFTISNTGAKGGFYATPIINHPEVAILGVHSMKEKPIILPNREIGIGHVMGFSLSFDHRIIDGEPAGKFMNDLKNYLENPASWFLKAR